MDIKLSFFGAARNVTGSRYLIESNGKRILLDCGMFQERRFQSRNWDPFPVTPSSIDAVVLSHAHLDHCGYLPRLVRDGFNGPVHCTQATAGIAEIIFLDSGHLQQEDAKRKLRRHKKRKTVSPYPVEPLYTVDDAMNAVPLLSPTTYEVPVDLGGGITLTFHDAGHILGASMPRFEIEKDGEKRVLQFSGDLGRWNKPILRDPTLFDQADYVVVESTYGDRVHADEGNIQELFGDVVNSTFKAGGNIVIPAFAVERSHEILYHLNALLLAKTIPPLMVFMDSPMAIKVTEVFKKHAELFDEEMVDFVESNHSPFAFNRLKMTRTAAESKTINHIRGTSIILAGSGMCTGGRVKHHLIHNITRPDSTILFTGYQAAGTLGRHILEGAPTARILGRTYPVRARVAKVSGFSGHGDRDDLLNWVSNLKTPPRRVFVTHGEEESALYFGKLLEEKIAAEIVVPEYGDVAQLD